MKLMLVGSAAVALMAMAGCTEYPAATHAVMAEALPPYHQDNDVDMDTAAGMTPVGPATHLVSASRPSATRRLPSDQDGGLRLGSEDHHSLIIGSSALARKVALLCRRRAFALPERSELKAASSGGGRRTAGAPAQSGPTQ